MKMTDKVQFQHKNTFSIFTTTWLSFPITLQPLKHMQLKASMTFCPPTRWLNAQAGGFTFSPLCSTCGCNRNVSLAVFCVSHDLAPHGPQSVRLVSNYRSCKNLVVVSHIHYSLVLANKIRIHQTEGLDNTYLLPLMSKDN
jgi:hypothetical protein